MNTGVAVIGFVVCFVAGAGLMWGYDAHNGVLEARRTSRPTPAARGATTTRPSRSTARTRCGGAAAPRSRSSCSRTSSAPSAAASSRPCSRSRTRTAPTRSASSGRTSRSPSTRTRSPRPRRRMGVFALAGNDGLLEVPRHRVQEPVGARPRQLHEVGAGRRREGHGQVQGRPRRPHLGRQGRQGQRRGEVGRRQRHPRLLHQRREPVGRAAVRQVQGRHRPGAHEGAGEDRERDAEGQGLRRDVEGEQGERPRRSGSRRGTAEGRHDDGVQGSARDRADGVEHQAARHDRRVFRLPVPLLQARRADAQADPRRRTATRSPSSGGTSRSPSTRTRSPPPRSRWKRSPRRGTRASGRRTTSSSTRSPSSRTPISASVAAALGLDAKKVDDAIKNHKWKKQIDDDNDLSQTLQASGTPHFFINGRRLVGAQPFDKFKEIIDERDHQGAGRCSRRGRSQKDLYAALMKNAKAAGRGASGCRGRPREEADAVDHGRSVEGGEEREGHGRRVLRLPVPLLQARRADGRADDEGLRRQD